MSDYGVEISTSSRVIIFQGNLKKAPQLNKRGRKKWKDRFIVLRACKTLECFKSKKALQSSKPRKVIDIRECINLEVGLEYKELQHIFSLGTFKRTFFFAAPSDALMLQWVDNIEKVKNATDGERIRILDIGLRKSPIRTTNSICSSQSMSKIAALCSSNLTLYQVGSMSNISRDAISDGERSPSLPPTQHPLTEFSSVATHVHSTPQNGSQETSPQHEKCHSSNENSPSHRRGHYYVNVSPRAPHVKNDKKKVVSQGIGKVASPQQCSPQHKPATTGKGRIPPPPTLASKIKPSPEREDCNPFNNLMESNKPEISRLHGMKHSFRYRKITLRKEKPVFGELKEEEEYSSDEEETDKEECQEKIEPFYRKKELAKSSPNLSEIGRPKAGRVKNVSRPSLTPHQVDTQSVDSQPFCPVYNQPTTSYCKVTVVGVKVQNYTQEDLIIESRNSIHNSTSDGALDTILPDPIEEYDEELDIVLPNRYSTDTIPNIDAVSVSSLDDIVVEPPSMFTESAVPNQTKPVPAKKSKVDSQIINKENEKSDRNSTESSDTGYTSSPSYNQNRDSKWSSSPLPNSTEKVCTPLVFYTKNVWKPNGNGKGLIGLQVCLVEQGNELLQDLLALKELEGYKYIECEVEEGHGTVTTPTGDTLTVETSLEDLEFGFKVVKSTQKDMFKNRVKAFDFEVKNLFSNNKKPFSCEVHVKHINDVVILPVELDLD